MQHRATMVKFEALVPEEEEEQHPSSASDSRASSSSDFLDDQGEQSFQLDDDETPRKPHVHRRLKTLVPRGSSVWTHSRTSKRRPSRTEGEGNSALPRQGVRDRPISCFCTADSYNVQDIYQHVSDPALNTTVAFDMTSCCSVCSLVHALRGEPGDL